MLIINYKKIFFSTLQRKSKKTKTEKNEKGKLWCVRDQQKSEKRMKNAQQP